MKIGAAALAVALVALLIALLALRPQTTPGPLLRDFEAYWSAGRTHGDPYGRTVWRAERTIAGVDARRDELLPFVSPPAALLGLRLIARLPYGLASRLWYGLLVVAAAALVALVARAGDARSVRAYGALAMLAVGSGAITADLALGQLALLATAGATAVAALPERPIAGTLGALLAALQPNLSLGLVALVGRNRTTIALASGAIAAYLAGVVAHGWAWPLAYLRVLSAHAAAERCDAIQVTPRAIACGMGASPTLATIVGIAVALAAIGGAIVLAPRIPDRFARFAAYGALVPLASVFLHGPDLVVAYPAAAWCALRARGRARTLALVGSMLVAVDWLGLAQRPDAIAQSAFLALGALAAFVAADADAPPALAPVTLGLALLFAGAAGLAAAHPAPVWPDALGPFHAPAQAAAATVWHAEQRASGLTARVPSWAALRSLSLLGCALLAGAIALSFGRGRDAGAKPG